MLGILNLYIDFVIHKNYNIYIVIARGTLIVKNYSYELGVILKGSRGRQKNLVLN